MERDRLRVRVNDMRVCGYVVLKVLPLVIVALSGPAASVVVRLRISASRSLPRRPTRKQAGEGRGSKNPAKAGLSVMGAAGFEPATSRV